MLYGLETYLNSEQNCLCRKLLNVYEYIINLYYSDASFKKKMLAYLLCSLFAKFGDDV